jgi:predicted kinase
LKTAYFLKGLPASGKTTWAKQKLAALNKDGKHNAVRVNKDEIRARLVAKGSASESKVILRETELVTKALKKGSDVLIDNTHIKPTHEWRYRDLAKEHGYKFVVVSFMAVSVEECIRRDRERRNSVGENVIRRMDDYRKSLSRGVVAALKEEWARKKAAATKKITAAKKLEPPVAKSAAVKRSGKKLLKAKQPPFESKQPA